MTGLLDIDELRAGQTTMHSAWDTSWVDRLTAASFRVVFNVSDIGDGAVLDYASTFLDHFREVHGTNDAQTRPVAVYRRLGTPMAFNDAMWDRYPIGKDRKLMDSATGEPVRRNIFWKAKPGASPETAARKMETLQRRGMISLVCNIATENWGRSLAEDAHLAADDVIRELKANLVPGAILVPSGIYALIRAQNAGCAYMPGT
jgi:intracellular sulfur oxidation DsrE/DsrF family protein